MNTSSRLLTLLLGMFGTGIAAAAPITIANYSFEVQTPELTAGQYTNNKEPSWKETNGPNNTLGYFEWLGLAGQDGTDTLGMDLGHNVWQDLSVTFQPNTIYTLTVAAGNRASFTVAGNSTQYALADTAGAFCVLGATDASTLTGVGSFADAPAVTFDTISDPCAVGRTIRVQLMARGTNRSHFDNIRLDGSASTQNGRPIGTLTAATGLTSTTATLNGTVTNIGSAAPTVIFYYDTSDKGSIKTNWTSSVVVAGGAKTGAFSQSVSGLTLGATYYYRALMTNASGEAWCSPCLSFTTLATAPTVINVAATNVLTDAATIGANVTSTGGSAPSITMFYGPTDGGTTPASWAGSLSLGTSSGVVTGGISGLTGTTQYYFRARAVNSGGTSWAPASSTFTTATALNVVNIAATGIDFNSAKLGATVSNTGGVPPTVTIYYGTVDGGTTIASWTNSQSLGGVITSDTETITGLLPATTYYFRARAVNAGSSGWAPTSATFTTAAAQLPKVTNSGAKNPGATLAEITGEVTSTGGNIPVVTMFWGTTNGGTNPASWTNSRVLGSDGGNFSTILTGLTAQTTYYFTSRAVNSVGTAWAGSSDSFVTGSATATSVVINEINYDPPDHTKATEFVELHNPTAAAIDMSGWQLSSKEILFTIPNGTSIAAGGFRVICQNTAAFTTAFPVGGTPVGQWLTGTLKNGSDLIQLKNGAGLLIDEVDYQSGFPWPSSAKGGGPSIELINPNLDNGLGASWRAGATPAVYVPLASSWRWRRGVQGDTGETATPFTSWRALNFVEPAVPATNAQWATNTSPFGFGENDGVAGETENTTPLSDMAGGALYTSIYMRKTFTIPAGQIPQFIQVKARVDDGCIVWINGVYVGAIRPNATILTGHHYYNTFAVNAPEPPPLETVATVSSASVNLVAGNNVIAIHALNTSASSSDFFIDAEVSQSFGGVGVSPNNPNATLIPITSSAPPAVRDVEHLPNQPAAGVPVVVTARITDADGIGPVTCLYQTVDPGNYIRKADAAYSAPGNWTSLTMVDNGTGGDAIAGDSIYSVTIPGTVQTHRRLIRYRISASDSLSNAVTVPYPDDEQGNFAYFCYNGVPAWTGAFRPTAFSGFPATAAQTFPPSLLNTIDPFQLITLDSDMLFCMYNGPIDNTAYQGTLVYDGVVYDNITYKIRGIGSTRVSGKNKLAFMFNRSRNFQGRDNWGKKYDQTWNSFGLDANASPWAAMNRGSAGIEEAASYRIFELGGMDSLRTNYAHFRVIRKAAESATAGTLVNDTVVGTNVDGQYTSDLWGLYMVLEPTEGNFLDERSLPDGNIYAIEGNGGDQKYQAASQPVGTDWVAFRDALALAGQNETWYRTNMDLPRLYNYIGLSRLVGNVDVRPGDNYRYYHRSSDNKWCIIPYDHDMQFIAGAHWGGTMDGVVVAGAPNSVMAMMRHPAIAQEYRNRCRELISLMASDASPNGGQVGQLLDEYSQMVNPTGVALTWADLDAAMWNLHPRSTGGGGNTGQSSHRGNFFRSLYLDGTRGGLGGTVQTVSYIRDLNDPDSDGFSDHEGLQQWFTNYATNTWPGGPWTRKATNAGPNAGGGGVDSDVNRQKGYGYKYLEFEAFYGGYFDANTNPPAGVAVGDIDAAGATLFPNKPTITYAGLPAFPANDLRFNSSAFSDPQGASTVAAVQWRIGEISAPGLPFYDPAEPRKYEVEELWRSAEIAVTSPNPIAQVRVPATFVRAGHVYRARVRHKDNTGRWSYWSEPVQFIVGVPDVTAFANVLRITEFNYNPGPVTPAESSAVGWNALWTEQEFEFIELANIDNAAVDLTDVRFTKGVDYNFPSGYTLPANSRVVIAKNPVAFAIRYGNTAILAPGSYNPDSLANGGEELKLSYGAGTEIIDLNYKRVAPWPATPNGQGPTLVLKTPTKPGLNHDDGNEWRASYVNNGNPGGSDGMNYNLWATGYPGLGVATADDDKDGFDNRLEYALGSDPKTPSTNATPIAAMAGGYVTLTFTRRTDAEDLTFAVQFSDELQTWNLPGVQMSNTPNGNGTQTEVWRSTDPVGNRNRIFGRVFVTQ